MKRYAILVAFLVVGCGSKTPFSKNERPFAMPNVMGLTEDEAKAELKRAGGMGEVRVARNGECPGVPMGRACGTTPGSGEKAMMSEDLVLTLQGSESNSKMDPGCDTFAEAAKDACKTHADEILKSRTP